MAQMVVIRRTTEPLDAERCDRLSGDALLGGGRKTPLPDYAMICYTAVRKKVATLS